MTDATDAALEKAARAFSDACRTTPWTDAEWAEMWPHLVGTDSWLRALKPAIEAYQAALPKGEMAERLEDWATFLETDQGNGCSPRTADEASTLLRAAASLLGGGVPEGVVIERCNYEAVMHHLQADGALDRRMLCELLAARPPESGRE